MQDISRGPTAYGCSNLANPSRVRNKIFSNSFATGWQSPVDFLSTRRYLGVFDSLQLLKQKVSHA